MGNKRQTASKERTIQGHPEVRTLQIDTRLVTCMPKEGNRPFHVPVYADLLFRTAISPIPAITTQAHHVPYLTGYHHALQKSSASSPLPHLLQYQVLRPRKQEMEPAQSLQPVKAWGRPGINRERLERAERVQAR
mgnify:CR=1 FL=1